MNHFTIQRHFRVATLLFLGTWLFLPKLEAVRLEVSDSPTNDLRLTLKAIESAKQSLYINAYEFTSKEIAAAVIQKIQEGVKVDILEEGQPVGGMGKAGIEIREKIVKEMSRSTVPSHFYVMSSDTPNGERQRRFRYDHAKYMITDDETLLIGSENYSPTGHPVQGNKGTRGWETRVHDKDLVSEFKKIFAQDSNLDHGDVYQMVEPRWQGPIPNFAFTTDWSSEWASKTWTSNRESSDDPKTLEADVIKYVTSPNTSLAGMLNFIKSSNTKLDLELMSFSYRWGNTGNVSPLFQAVVDAARRGVAVRVLLNDESVFNGGSPGDEFRPSKKHGNEITIEQFQTIALKEKLNLSADIADVDAMGVKYIHNKGILADGDRTFVSSINWNRNSVENNRETAVVITGHQVHDYYASTFEQDWACLKAQK